MGKLVVSLVWPTSQVPWISSSSLWLSDVRLEPEVDLLRGNSFSGDCNGNLIIREAIDRGATELLCIDGDQSVPPDVLKRLRAHDKDVVSAVTPSRQPGHPWLTFKINEQGVGYQENPKFPLTRVDVVGMGCVLIKMRIFNIVPPPWFKTTLSNDGCGVVQSPDFFFFKKLKEHGIEVFVDSTLESYHLTEQVLNTKTLGRKLPHIEAVSGYTIPNTSADALAEDREVLCNI